MERWNDLTVELLNTFKQFKTFESFNRNETMRKLLEYDGVVIGAGHNGMICAGYLAKCGQKIMVVEKNMEAINA